MTNIADIIERATMRPGQLTADDLAELRRACRDFPASALAPAILLKYGDADLSDAERTDLRARVALYGGCDGALVRYVDPDGRDFTTFYPPAPDMVKPTTEAAIDTFLETYGHQSAEEDALLERMIFNPVPDYAEQLARDTTVEEGGDWQDNLIDAFLATQAPAKAEVDTLPAPATPAPPVPPKAPARPARAVAPAPAPDTLLSESLAKIFIKQGRYERAYEIITNLSLNYPKKSVYFADQLRFLQKLIINQRHAKATEDK